jgi:glycerate kinase
MFRRFFSQTKGGRLAEASFPAQMVSLILSDVIGDPLDTIASGPTTPSVTTHHDITTLAEKYNLTESLPLSIRNALSQQQRQSTSDEAVNSRKRVPIENGEYRHVQNVIVGSNRLATEAAADKARAMGYRPGVWSHSVHGEARLLGEAYAILAHCAMEFSYRTAVAELRKTPPFENLIQNNPGMGGEFQALEEALIEHADVTGTPCNLCLISSGEPTVTVTGDGRGGRNQELALAFSLRLSELQQSSSCSVASADCVLVGLGTDGQDGPTDAAGAVGHSSLVLSAGAQGLDAADFLRRNDSYSFFSRVEDGNYLLKTGLTGTNVMDIHCILFTSYCSPNNRSSH